MKMKSESEVAQLCPTLSDPMDCSLPGFSIHGIFQARVLESGAIASPALYDNLKQKEGEGPKAGAFNSSKGWFENFRKRLGFKNVKRTGEAASADQKSAYEFPCH